MLKYSIEWEKCNWHKVQIRTRLFVEKKKIRNLYIILKCFELSVLLVLKNVKKKVKILL